MRKNVFGRRFKRDKNQRKALFKSLMSSLVLEERIKTTEEKAKAIKGQIEKLVTKVKKKGVFARNQLQDYLVPKAIDKFLTDTALRFQNRRGGYTRLIRLGKRLDSSMMVLMEWVETEGQGQEVSVSQPVSAKEKVKGPARGEARQRRQTKTKTKTKRAATTKAKTKIKKKEIK